MTLSVEFAKKHLAKGYATELINAAIADTPEKAFIKKILRKKTGLSLKAASRCAQRMLRMRACIYAKPKVFNNEPSIISILRFGQMNLHLQYCREDVSIHQDAICYVLANMSLAGDIREQIAVLIPRHALERWVERGGAGDPRESIQRKIDRSITKILLDTSLSECCALVLREGTRDRNGESARFGIPDELYGVWVAGLAGTRNTSRNAMKNHFRVSFLTYLGNKDLASDQKQYVERAISEGMAIAVSHSPDTFARGVKKIL